MFTKLFFKDVLERAIFTFAQALLALFLVAPQTPLLAFDWPSALGLAGTAAVIALLKGVVGAALVKDAVSPASLAPVDHYNGDH